MTDYKWGAKETVHRFTDTPFGDVELSHFEKTGSESFTLWLRIASAMATIETMDVLWRNCHADDAWTFFGIERSEQRMERA
jgi:hypothetical protein